MQQTYKNFDVIIRDDYSSDTTIGIIKEFIIEHNNITFISGNKNVGAASSFNILIKLALEKEYEFVFFADQDDIWLESKIQKTIDSIKNTKKEIPVLVHTDLKVVNEELNRIHDSFWNYQNINPKHIALNRLLMQNVITGCTTLMNRKLLELAYPIPSEAIMHDWWVALVASAFGEIYHIKEPTVLYRQHANNEIGAKKFNINYILKSMFKRYSLHKNVSQAECLLKCFESTLLNEQKNLLINYILLIRRPHLQRLFYILKYRFFKNGLVRNVGMFFRLRSEYD